MIVQRSINEPLRIGLSWEERWLGSDQGLIACWEQGRRVGQEKPKLAEICKSGTLIPLPWKGGVSKATNQTQRFGSFRYLAMWYGLRFDDLTIDLLTEVPMVCKKTGMTVIFTPDASKYVLA